MQRSIQDDRKQGAAWAIPVTVARAQKADFPLSEWAWTCSRTTPSTVRSRVDGQIIKVASSRAGW